MPPLVALKLGTRFAGRFDVLGVIASGGQATVYEVLQLATQRRRALKLLHAMSLFDDRSRERFAREAVLSARIQSEHVIEVVDAGVDPETGTPWLLMELLVGETLAQRVAREGALGVSTVRRLASELGHALRAAHRAGVVHRDLKPENIFLANTNSADAKTTLKVLDFGIAYLTESHRTGNNITESIGSSEWMSPEQVLGQQIDVATDVWTLGLLAFWALTGKSYWLAASQSRVSSSSLRGEVVQDPLVSASRRARELGVKTALPAGFDAWFAQCVHRDRRQRFADGGVACEGLQRVLGGGPSQAVTRKSGRSRASVIALGTVLVSAVLAGSYLGFSRWVFRPHTTTTPVPVLRAPATPVPVTHRSQPGVSPTQRSLESRRCPVGMAYVPGGIFQMGSDERPETRPVHQVQLSPYCIDITEVTTAAYRRCLNARGCTDLHDPAEHPEDRDLCNINQQDHENHPVNCVDWEQSQTYCQWAQARLPTEAEWEFAARGPAGLPYPWGTEEPSPRRLNACGLECVRRRDAALHYTASDRWSNTSPIGFHSQSRSPFGLFDMTGNVAEWVADWYGEYPSEPQRDPTGPITGSRRIQRGGGFLDPPRPGWFRLRTAARHVPRSGGFRCAANPLPASTP